MSRRGSGWEKAKSTAMEKGGLAPITIRVWKSGLEHRNEAVLEVFE